MHIFLSPAVTFPYGKRDCLPWPCVHTVLNMKKDSKSTKKPQSETVVKKDISRSYLNSRQADAIIMKIPYTLVLLIENQPPYK